MDHHGAAADFTTITFSRPQDVAPAPASPTSVRILGDLGTTLITNGWMLEIRKESPVAVAAGGGIELNIHPLDDLWVGTSLT